MRSILVALLLLILAGCSGSSGDTTWVVRTNFSEGDGRTNQGMHVAVRSGERLSIIHVTPEPEPRRWDLDFYDAHHVYIVDQYYEKTPDGHESTWVLQAHGGGDTWLQFGLYEAESPDSQLLMTYMLDIE